MECKNKGEHSKLDTLSIDIWYSQGRPIDRDYIMNFVKHIFYPIEVDNLGFEFNPLPVRNLHEYYESEELENKLPVGNGSIQVYILPHVTELEGYAFKNRAFVAYNSNLAHMATTVAHEIGHILGLNHPWEDGESEWCTRIMGYDCYRMLFTPEEKEKMASNLINLNAEKEDE